MSLDAVRQLLTIEQVAELLQVPVDTLYYWRSTKYGPQAMKVGKYLRWRQDAINAWLESLEQAASPTSNVTSLKSRRPA